MNYRGTINWPYKCWHKREKQAKMTWEHVAEWEFAMRLDGEYSASLSSNYQYQYRSVGQSVGSWEDHHDGATAVERDESIKHQSRTRSQ